MPDPMIQKLTGADRVVAMLMEDREYLRAENKRLKTALERIAKWFGEFPETGQEWPSGGAVSYGALYGSHGERDYMRKVAADALNPEQAEPKCIGFSGCHDGKHDWSCPVEDE